MIEVTGPATSIDKIEEVKLICDVSGAHEDIKTNVDVQFYTKKGKKVDGSHLRYDEKSISVLVEIWKQKVIPIEVTTVGKVTSGYTVASVEYEPKEIAIAGPDDELKNINNIQLEKIDISGATADVEKNISLLDTLLPGNIIFQESNKNVAVKVKIGRKTEREIPFSLNDIEVVGATEKQNILFLDEQYTVTISGLEKDIQNITISDLAPHIEIGGLSDGNHTVTIKVVENKNIDVTSIDSARIDIETSTLDN